MLSWLWTLCLYLAFLPPPRTLPLSPICCLISLNQTSQCWSGPWPTFQPFSWLFLYLFQGGIIHVMALNGIVGWKFPNPLFPALTSCQFPTNNCLTDMSIWLFRRQFHLVLSTTIASSHLNCCIWAPLSWKVCTIHPVSQAEVGFLSSYQYLMEKWSYGLHLPNLFQIWLLLTNYSA